MAAVLKTMLGKNDKIKGATDLYFNIIMIDVTKISAVDHISMCFAPLFNYNNIRVVSGTRYLKFPSFV